MRILKEIKTDDIIFIDTETVRLVDKLEIDTPLYESWEYKMARIAEEEGFDMLEKYEEKGAFYPEFARLVCITVGRIRDGKIVLTTYSDKDEKELLTKFNRDLNFVTKRKPLTKICGHSIIDFHIPFIMKRCVVNQVFPNQLLDVAGLKPWEIDVVDIKDVWKGSGRYTTSLVNIAVALGVDAPKTKAIGDSIGYSFYNDELKKIIEVAEKSVVSLVNVVRVMRFEPQLTEVEIQEVQEELKENVFTRIGDTGFISESDYELIIEKSKKLDYSAKEKMIKMLKGILAMHKDTLSQELELAILSN